MNGSSAWLIFHSAIPKQKNHVRERNGYSVNRRSNMWPNTRSSNVTRLGILRTNAKGRWNRVNGDHQTSKRARINSPTRLRGQIWENRKLIFQSSWGGDPNITILSHMLQFLFYNRLLSKILSVYCRIFEYFDLGLELTEFGTL